MELEELNSQEYKDAWACKLTARQDTWSHARRRRRIEQRSLENPNQVKNMHIEPQVTNEPWLVCNVCVTIDNYTTLKICLLYERGRGGQNGLETLRHYLINQLSLREYLIQMKSLSNSNKNKRRKRNPRKIDELE